MSRGFQLASLDVGTLQDPKFIKLSKLVRDERECAVMVVIYLQTTLESWRCGERVTAYEAEILWEPSVEHIEALQKVGLLDEDARVTVSAWERHYGAALERTERRRMAGRKGGIASGKRRKGRSNDASTKVERHFDDASAALDLTPADTPSPKGEAGVGRAGLRVLDAPTRPPVRMERLDEADTEDIERLLVTLPKADGRRRKLQAELASRQATDGQARAAP